MRSHTALTTRVTVALTAAGTVALTAGVLCASALAASPPPPGLAYVAGKDGNQVWVANSGGTQRRRVGTGYEPLLAPSGQSLAVATATSSGHALVLYSTSTGRITGRYFNVKQVSAFPDAWSPDSRYLAVTLLSNTLSSTGGLAIIDTQTGTAKTIGRGAISGASFAPTGAARVVYGRSASMSLTTPVDIYTAGPDGRGTRAITHDGRSLNPLWGPTTIAFDHEQLRRNDAPIYQVWLMRPDGSGRRQITHLHVPSLLSGLVPLGWSADGRRMVARYEGQDTSDAWTLVLSTRRAREIVVNKQSVEGWGISRNGASVLIDIGGFQNEASNGTVASIPFGGGRATVLVRHAHEPSWNR